MQDSTDLTRFVEGWRGHPGDVPVGTPIALRHGNEEPAGTQSIHVISNDMSSSSQGLITVTKVQGSLRQALLLNCSLMPLCGIPVSVIAWRLEMLAHASPTDQVEIRLRYLCCRPIRLDRPALPADRCRSRMRSLKLINGIGGGVRVRHRHCC